jgi:Protein of unknown function (DUF3300)
LTPEKQVELDQMLAPVALYPDALLSQILMASTYPLEIVQAECWSQANPTLRGEAAVQAAQTEDWDPSVRSLVAFPQVLQTMDQKLNWTERLGSRFRRRRYAGSAPTALRKLKGARLMMPWGLSVVIHAIGRGTTRLVMSL